MEASLNTNTYLKKTDCYLLNNKYIGFNKFLNMLRVKFPQASKMDARRILKTVPFAVRPVKKNWTNTVYMYDKKTAVSRIEIKKELREQLE